MLNIQYFASIRETLGRDGEELELPKAVVSVQDLIEHLLAENPHFSTVFAEGKKVLVAVNQTVVETDHRLAESDEVAFFPPMTGG